MDIVTILALILMGVPAGSVAMPKLKAAYASTFGSSSKLPHDAVETLIVYFNKQGDAEGAKFAKACGKRLYDGMKDG